MTQSDWWNEPLEISEWDPERFAANWRLFDEPSRRQWLQDAILLHVPLDMLMTAPLTHEEKTELGKLYLYVARLAGQPQQVLAAEIWLSQQKEEAR